VPIKALGKIRLFNCRRFLFFLFSSRPDSNSSRVYGLRSSWVIAPKHLDESCFHYSSADIGFGAQFRVYNKLVDSPMIMSVPIKPFLSRVQFPLRSIYLVLIKPCHLHDFKRKIFHISETKSSSFESRAPRQDPSVNSIPI
jgi:hypothetical protein